MGRRARSSNHMLRKLHKTLHIVSGHCHCTLNSVRTNCFSSNAAAPSGHSMEWQTTPADAATRGARKDTHAASGVQELDKAVSRANRSRSPPSRMDIAGTMNKKSRSLNNITRFSFIDRLCICSWCILQVFGVRPSAGGTEAAAHYSLQQRLQVVRSFNAANAARSLQVSSDAVVAGLDPFQVLTCTPLSKTITIIELRQFTTFKILLMCLHGITCATTLLFTFF
jgi:hypothetical protein